MKTYFAAAGGAIFFLTYCIYIAAIARGRCRPARASWLVFMLASWVAAIAMLASGKLNAIAVLAALATTIIFCLSLKHGKEGWSNVDVASVMIALAGLVLYLLTGNAEVAISLVVGVGIIATVPTWVSTLQDPSREHRLAWFVGLVGAILAFHGIPEHSIVASGQTASFIFVNLVQVTILYFKRAPDG
jgi:hypothetical protein